MMRNGVGNRAAVSNGPSILCMYSAVCVLPLPHSTKSDSIITASHSL